MFFAAKKGRAAAEVTNLNFKELTIEVSCKPGRHSITMPSPYTFFLGAKKGRIEPKIRVDWGNYDEISIG